MNRLLIGHADKTEQLLQTSGGFLLIDDGPIADAFLTRFPRAALFDVAQHHFNPLKAIDYKVARDFVSLIYALSPQGENTLTVRNGKRALLTIFLEKPHRLDKLPKPKDDAQEEALGMIEELLISTVVSTVLCNPTNFSFKPSRQIVAKLDRAQLGDFDCLVLATLLIGQFQGQIIVPDAGFYLREFHSSLIRQDRLTAGLSSLSEVSGKLAQALLGVKNKCIYKVSPQDAQKLIVYTRHVEPNILVRQTGTEYTPAE